MTHNEALAAQGAEIDRLCNMLLIKECEIARLRTAIKKYLSHELSHQESYTVLREALGT